MTTINSQFALPTSGGSAFGGTLREVGNTGPKSQGGGPKMSPESAYQRSELDTTLVQRAEFRPGGTNLRSHLSVVRRQFGTGAVFPTDLIDPQPKKTESGSPRLMHSLHRRSVEG